MEVQAAAKDRPPEAAEGPRLLSPEESVGLGMGGEAPAEEAESDELDADAVFAKLRAMKGEDAEPTEEG
jgi:hypothetical protein